jgi:hypothetical protein
VARCGICQPRLWLDVAWRGLVPVDVGSPFGSPSSLAPLTFSNRILPRSSERGEAGSSPSVGGRRSARCLLHHERWLPGIGRQSADPGDVEDPDDLGGIIGMEVSSP